MANKVKKVNKKFRGKYRGKNHIQVFLLPSILARYNALGEIAPLMGYTRHQYIAKIVTKALIAECKSLNQQFPDLEDVVRLKRKNEANKD